MSNTNYNPAQSGKCFNEQPPQGFKDITEQEKLDALKKIDELVDDTRAELQEN